MAVAIAAAIGLRPFLYWQNETLEVTHYTVQSEKLPRSFDGYKIVLLTDIHGKVFEGDNAPLYEAIEAQEADMLCLVGDLIDEGVAGSKEVVANLLRTCELPGQVYAVSGNHDVWTEGFNAFVQELEEAYPITFLENESVQIEKDGETLTLSGISDPDTWDEAEAMEYVAAADASIKKGTGYQILLFHRANMLDYFNDKAYDLILSGHMHGGQVRLPFVGGLKSPHGDWFPKYSGGRYDAEGKTYIVSRGVGNAVRVPRLFNRPELVVVTLQCG
ncbi:MAG TPA: metallophosphoesterase [Candidatus Aphodoplasma excrementigallinarum]|uniref:Metallophosphoesterase n=1 Tax=Candidatus Aphodoplasma excrementigallinarum TaxID=2840673 RepID=A0A9D1NHL3_9FIRM|nr:metallophosphoesterase [Candidatus Aphodoplasma excrementigallinarum]